MNNSFLSKGHTSFNLPKASDAGLSEWSSKIKAIQKEVDEDAEDEQRRLQEEIEASRLERARRRNTASIDWTRNASVGNMDNLSGTSSTAKLNDTKNAISLAAFIGGRATGPYLTKPAPQVNSYDTNLFELPKRDGPHPIFGKPLIRSHSQTRLNDIDEPSIFLSQQKTEVVLPSSNRITSSEKPVSSFQTTSMAEAIQSQGPGLRPTKSQRATGEIEDTYNLNTSITPKRALPELTLPVPPSPASKPSISTSAPNTFSIPNSTTLPSITVSPFLPMKPIPTSSLSIPRPVQFQANVSPSIAEASPAPAPAFLRPIPTTEELHPSLTKLQGRGFVEQRVKATTTPKKSSPLESREKADTPSPKLRKHPSVLDRWQPASTYVPTSAREEKSKTPEKPTVGKLVADPLDRKPSRSSSKEIIEEPRVIPLPGMASVDLQYTPFEPTSTGTRVIAPSIATSVMVSTALNHPTRDRPKKPKKAKNIHGTDNGLDDQLQELIKTIESSSPTADTINDVKLPVVEPLQSSIVVDSTPLPQTPVTGSPKSPNRHSRIPSTGQRATVMDVAQAMLEHDQASNNETFDMNQRQEMLDLPYIEEEQPRPDVRAIVAQWGQKVGITSTETKKSSYERYSIATATTLPPLFEVQTPAETPQASLSRSAFNYERVQTESIRALQNELRAMDIFQEDERGLRQATGGATANGVLSVKSTTPDSETNQPLTQKDEGEEIELAFQQKIPPPFNPQQVIKETPFILDSSVQTISTEVNIISSGVAVPVTQEQNIFYDTEVIVVIYRSKQKSSELVSNQAWVWRGKNSNWEREEHKATELARKFDKKTVNCSQGLEPTLLIHILGGVLATRQGTRSHWSPENTTMHRIHRVGDCMFVDEVDLGVWNLCSAYSCCLCVLGTTYVWHGRGSTEDERRVALSYATTSSQGKSPVVEIEEGFEDEIIWMVLGRAEYPNAYHWKFRDQLDRLGARVYAVDSSKTRAPVQVLPTTSARELQGGVFVIDCRLEVYVLVNSEARGKRVDIQLALILAENISSNVAHKRPFTPPVHVVVLPSRLPLELRAALRFCEEAVMNGGEVPNHMNLVTLSDAVNHMQCSVWPRSTLNDANFLPVGVAPSMLP